MDDDPVLRSLSADLERDDPALADLLSGRTPSAHRHSAARHSVAWHSVAWLLLALPLLVPALLLPLRVTLGLLAMTLILSSPALVCWLCAVTEGSATRRT